MELLGRDTDPFINLKSKIYKVMISPVELYECGTLGYLKKERRWGRMECFKALRRIFGPKKQEITREWIKLFNKVLYILHP